MPETDDIGKPPRPIRPTRRHLRDIPDESYSLPKQFVSVENGPLKLHLGCGDKHLDGFVNIDQRDLPTADELDDITLLRRVRDESVDLIYACHCLNHIPRPKIPGTLRRWWEVLKPGGVLRLSVPNFDAIVDEYMYGSLDLRKLLGLLYARQDYPANVTRCTWNAITMREDLETAGFTGMRYWNWREVEHGGVDDYSQAYLPHMDKDNGRLMSLNVEAVKPAGNQPFHEDASR